LKFSVVIPLYNKENFIAQTLNSVLAQSFTDFEVLVINDCSTDGSEQVVKTFEDSRIRLLRHTNNSGLSASRNTGIKNAQANYVAFLDADDLWKPDFLKSINFLIENYPEASLFATKYELKLDQNNTTEFHFDFENFTTHGIVSNFFKTNLNQSIFYPSCLCVKKDVFETVGHYNETVNYSEDIDFNIRAFARFKLAYFNKALVTYLMVSENQITQKGLLGKKIPDYDFYEEKFKDRKDIKKYLDFQRYIKAKLFKLAGDTNQYKSLISKIDPSNLNIKQKILLHLPVFVLKWIGKSKQLLLKKGINLNSYSD